MANVGRQPHLNLWGLEYESRGSLVLIRRLGRADARRKGEFVMAMALCSLLGDYRRLGTPSGRCLDSASFCHLHRVSPDRSALWYSLRSFSGGGVLVALEASLCCPRAPDPPSHTYVLGSGGGIAAVTAMGPRQHFDRWLCLWLGHLCKNVDQERNPGLTLYAYVYCFYRAGCRGFDMLGITPATSQNLLVAQPVLAADRQNAAHFAVG